MTNTITEAMAGLVSVRQIDFDHYPQAPPYDPGREAIEYAGEHFAEGNDVYRAVRQALLDLGLDRERRGTKEWSPFAGFIAPGDKVVIKPNLVIDADLQDAVTTHASVVRPVVDYAWKALRGEGTITICDAPMVETDLDKVLDANGLREMIDILNRRGYRIDFEDLRARRTRKRHSVVIEEQTDRQKMSESVAVDLKELSCLEADGVKWNRLSDGSYGRQAMRLHHQKGKHLYRIAKKVLQADVVISLPKLKTHKKAGFTCCLKNLVGINVDKNYLPHFTSGPANLGGDEFPRIAAWRLPLWLAYSRARALLLGRFGSATAGVVSACAGLLERFRFSPDRESPTGRVDVARRVYHLLTGTDYGGSWSGNETIWRMILDLNRVLLYADSSGELRGDKQRKTFFVVDGFIAGARNGPLTPQVVKAGIVAAGFNAALVDQALLELAGIDTQKIPLYREALSGKAAWLHEGLPLRIGVNGDLLDPGRIRPIARLREPKWWSYEKKEPLCEEGREGKWPSSV
jgi:uncharacterized protein (DUF362 family)